MSRHEPTPIEGIRRFIVMSAIPPPFLPFPNHSVTLSKRKRAGNGSNTSSIEVATGLSNSSGRGGRMVLSRKEGPEGKEEIRLTEKAADQECFAVPPPPPL